ncbi:MAG: putative phage tail protein [Planctomycetota bacterium]
MVVATPYARLLRELLPPGRLFATDPEATLSRLLEGLATEFARVDAQAGALPDQLDPARGSWALPDWERVLGLPDRCGPAPETVDARRAAVLGRLLSGGSLSVGFYQSLASSLGYSIAIEEGSATRFECGTSACGDSLGTEATVFQIDVLVAGGTERVFECGVAACGDPLGDTSDELLECVLERAAPAHVSMTFRYPDPAEYFLGIPDGEGGLIRVYAFDGDFYVVDELGQLIRLDVVDDVLTIRDENGDPILIPLVQEAT